MTTIIRRANRLQDNIRVVSIFYGNLITEVPPQTNGCGNHAKTCQIPVKNGTTLLSWRQGCCSGILVMLMEIVRKRLGFNYTLYIVEDGKWGSKNNGTWNGMIRDLVDGKADLSLQTMGFQEERLRAIDYSPPIDLTAFGILRIKSVKEEFPNWSFLNPMSKELNYAIAGTALLAVCVILLLENGRFLSRITTERFSFREAMVYVFGLTFQRDMGATNPRMWSGRLAALSYALAMTIIMSIYTARITANSITGIVVDDFKGFDDEKVGAGTVVLFLNYFYNN